MNLHKARIRATKCAWSYDVELRFGIENSQGGYDIAKPLVFESIRDGYPVEPFINLHNDVAQNLMDELWHCGFRPTEGTGSAGAYAAQGKHLEDMRLLVLKDKYKERKC